MEINFCDKVVVISGALGGLGRSMAKSFAENGAKVVVCDLRGSAEFAKELSDSGAQITGLDFDLTDREAVRAAADDIAESNDFNIVHLYVTGQVTSVHNVAAADYSHFKYLRHIFSPTLIFFRP